jgi:hypothetical protein
MYDCSFLKYCSQLHVTSVRSDHRTTMLHTINRFCMEIPISPVVEDFLWRDVHRVEFGTWIQSSNNNAIAFANNNWTLFNNRIADQPLKCLFSGTASNVNQSNIVIMKPMFDLQTLSYEDIHKVIDDFFVKYIQDSGRKFAFVFGDQQTWVRLWMIHMQDPDVYRWLIPIPGEWHWTWHILKAIYRTYYYVILLPLSKVLGYTSLDREADNFHYAEDFLELVTIAVTK